MTKVSAALGDGAEVSGIHCQLTDLVGVWKSRIYQLTETECYHAAFVEKHFSDCVGRPHHRVSDVEPSGTAPRLMRFGIVSGRNANDLLPNTEIARHAAFLLGRD
ncbi:UNVERIFIED_ORG: hypothetical protein J2W19_003179 [Shinella zoogloeoides]|nr:hypothetical protein [Shinella zoogloeoides]